MSHSHAHAHGSAGCTGHRHHHFAEDEEHHVHGHGHAHGGHHHHHGHSHGGHPCEHHHALEDDDDLDALEGMEVNDALINELLPHVPPEIKQLPEEQQRAYVVSILEHYAAQRRKMAEEKKAAEEYFTKVQREYELPDKTLLDIDTWPFEESFLKAARCQSREELLKVITEVHPGIYRFPLVKPEFCKRLSDAVMHFEKWCEERKVKIQRPNTMNNYGAILDHFGFAPTLDALMKRYIEPIARLLFPHVFTTLPSPSSSSSCPHSHAHPHCHHHCEEGRGGSCPSKQQQQQHETKEGETAVSERRGEGKEEEGKELNSLDSHHGFVVEYQVGKDTELGYHVDDSDVTMNLCLGSVFEGGLLYFGGVRCARHQQTDARKEEEALIDHKVGQALLHLGKHRHAARPITSGHRLNLILWCRSSGFHASGSGLRDCAPWCGMYQPPVEASP